MGRSALVVVAAAVAIAGLWVGDAALQSRELGKIADKSKLVTAAAFAGAMEMALGEDPESAAIESGAKVRARCDAVADVFVLPWHVDVARAKNAVGAYCEAVDAATIASPEVLDSGEMDIGKALESRATSEKAGRLLEEAVPSPAFFGVRKRIAQIGPPITD